MARWDYKLDGGTYSDAPSETIVELLGQGRMHGHDAVCKTGTDRWTPVERTELWDEHKRRNVLVRERRVDLPKLGRPRGAEFYVLWFIITAVGSGLSWNAAQSYNPEGNGMFNLVEASLLNHAWIQVVAALMSATFTSLFFAAILIAGRIRASTLMSREAHILMIEELRLTREALAGLSQSSNATGDVRS